MPAGLAWSLPGWPGSAARHRRGAIFWPGWTVAGC